jgi:hypothetical protein
VRHPGRLEAVSEPGEQCSEHDHGAGEMEEGAVDKELALIVEDESATGIRFRELG